MHLKADKFQHLFTSQKKKKSFSRKLEIERNFLNLIDNIYQKSMYTSVQFSSVAQSCPTLCDPMDCSMRGLPVHHQYP